MSWNPVTIVTGDNGFICRRALASVKKKAQKENRQILSVDASDPQELQDVLTTSPLFDETSETLVFLQNAEKIKNVDGLLKHHNGGDSEISVIAYFPKSVPAKLKKLVEGIGKGCVKTFAMPKPWDAQEAACQFGIKEVARNGFKTELKDISPVVYIVGSQDYGALSYEILKGCMYAQSLGEIVVKREHFVKVIASVYRHDAFPIMKSLGAKDPASISRKLGIVKKTSKEDPTMGICGLLGSQLVNWVSVVQLKSEGDSFEDIGQRIGMHPYRLKKEFGSVVRNWKVGELVELIRGVASVERGVKTGRANPWVELNVLLYSACRS